MFGVPSSVANVPLPVVDAYHVMPAVTAGIIHAIDHDAADDRCASTDGRA